MGEPRHFNAWENFNFENFTVDEFFNEATYPMRDVLPFFGFDHFDSNITVEPFFLLEHGRCFTLTPNNESTAWNSIGYVLFLTHTDLIKKVTQSGISTSGFNVYIHDRRDVYSGDLENCDSLMDSIYVEAGEEMRVNLKLQVYSQLPTNYHKCNDSYFYSKSKCRRDCLHKAVSELTGCSAPWVPNPNLSTCNTYHQMRHLLREYTINYTTHSDSCNCPRSCNLRVYTPYIQARKDVDLPNGVFMLSFSSNLVTIMEEIVGYDWNMFLADLGGSLGFLLGISVLGAIGALEHMYKAVVTRKNEKAECANDNNNDAYLNDRKLIDDLVSKNNADFYGAQNDKQNIVEKKY